MSDFLNDKDYSSYFKELERTIEKKPVNDTDARLDATVKRTVSPQIKRKKKYRVIRLKPKFVAAIIGLLAVIISGVLIFNSVTTPKATAKAESSVSSGTTSVTAKAKAKKEKPYCPKYAEYSEKSVEIAGLSDSRNIIVIDTKQNSVVASRAAEERVYPASTTKIMTLLVAVENIDDFEDTFTMTLDITDPLFVQEASVAGFLNGETITLTDMLYGTILPSGADAAIGLAIKVAGSEENFVKLMNKKVKALGLKNTHFTNVSGLFDQNHYTTAHDMALILEAAMHNSICKKVLSTYQYTTSATPQHTEGILLTSTLFSHMYGTEPETATINGGKTGFVSESGYCIASFGTNNETKNEYVCVTLGGSSLWPSVYGQFELYKAYAK